VGRMSYTNLEKSTVSDVIIHDYRVWNFGLLQSHSNHVSQVLETRVLESVPRDKRIQKYGKSTSSLYSVKSVYRVSLQDQTLSNNG
jgi:hypothetical protein